MNILVWFLIQLLSYHFWWVVFLAITYFAAKKGRWWCIPIGHLLIAIVVFIADVAWIRAEMAKPGWSPDKGPDQDVIFFFGMMARICLINLVLLPISIIVYGKHKRPNIRPSDLPPADAAGSRSP